jgi:hypothetical protein
VCPSPTRSGNPSRATKILAHSADNRSDASGIGFGQELVKVDIIPGEDAVRRPHRAAMLFSRRTSAAEVIPFDVQLRKQKEAPLSGRISEASTLLPQKVERGWLLAQSPNSIFRRWFLMG